VAHDFNNIIASILMQVDLLNLLPFHSSEQNQGLHQIRTDALRAADLTRQLLTFSRKQVPRFVELDLNEVIRKLVKMSERIVGDRIALDVDLASGPLVTLADAGMLDQLMMNLVGNARDAMPDGGRISVRTEERTLTPEEARSIPEGRPGRYVVLMISDTGCGIPPEILAQIFEPFFTTEQEGKGTGLGLATVYGIVSPHQGLLTVGSTVGKGTSFQIFLPASSARLAAPVALTTSTRSIGGRETILLVEDRASLRKLTGILLLEIGRHHPGRIDLLLTDLQMPGGIGGVKLGDRLSALCADLRIIFVSGGTVDTAGDGLCLSSKRIFVGKPTQPGALLEMIRTCLDG
jgi:two-component system cell cycle sensor histidine kinase/response regulator CckA